MTEPHDRGLRANAPRVAHELVDDEVVIIDFTTGAYFSAVGTAAEAWISLAAGTPPDEVAAEFASRYGANLDEARNDVTRFVEQLVADALLVARDDHRVEEPMLPPPAAAYTAPELERFTDLTDLILLDPVHDVTAQGWPHPRGSDGADAD